MLLQFFKKPFLSTKIHSVINIKACLFFLQVFLAATLCEVKTATLFRLKCFEMCEGVEDEETYASFFFRIKVMVKTLLSFIGVSHQIMLMASPC